MKRNRLFITLVLAQAVLLISSALVYAQTITFTGDVEVDFPMTSRYPDRGGVGDVGVPAPAPMNTAVGWDLENVGIGYDEATDTLFVGFNMGNGAISGDADGDGDPDQTAMWLDDLQGSDRVSLGGTEAIDMLFDLDQSCDLGTGQASDFEVVAGIPNNGNITAFAVAPFSQDPDDFTAPGAGYVSPTTFTGSVFASPSAMQPDLEFQIDDFCSTILPNCTPGVSTIAFAFRARAGSAADDGVGEDAIVCTDVSIVPTAVTLSDIRAQSGSVTPVAWAAGLLLLLVAVTGGVWVGRQRTQVIAPPAAGSAGKEAAG